MSARAMSCLLPLLAGGCGPVAIGAGLGSLARPGDETVVLLFVNDGDEALVLDITGVATDGKAITFRSDAIAAAATAAVALPRAAGLRVRAAQQTLDLASPPVTWDFRVDQATAPRAYGLGLEAVIAAGLKPTATAADRLVFDRLTGDEAGAAFARVAEVELPAAPDRVAVHPGGAYLYTVRDTPTGAEITALRVDARTGAMQVVGAEFGTTPANPRTIAHDGAFADLDVFVDAVGRVLFVVQRLPALHRSVLSLVPILADGSLGPPATAVRGLVGDVALRADGRRLYATEDLDGSGYVLRDYVLTATGGIDFLAAEAPLPCVATEAGKLALHPGGRTLYVAFSDPGSGQAKVGAFFVGDNGGLFALGNACTDFATIADLVVDPGGTELRATGTVAGGAPRVVRYGLDPQSGALGAFAAQDLGDCSRLAATEDPSRASSDPLRRVVYVAIGDRLVPHLRQPGGALAAVPGGVALDYGDSSNSHFVRGLRRGCVTLASEH